MKSHEHFLQMLLGLPEWEPGLAQRIGIKELSELLCCTPRNVKLILRKWEKEGLLKWQPGVGRGHHSTLTILCDVGQFLSDSFQQLLAEGSIREAVELLQHKSLPVNVKLRLHEVWNAQFGFVAEEGEARRQDVLRIPRERAFSTVDPAFVAVSAESHFIQQICHTLIIFDPATQSFRPQLAHAWESDREMTSWTFYLRKGVRFHHGRVLTGKDVAYTVQRLIDLDSPYRWQVEDIASIEHPDDYTIIFHLREPNGFFLHLAASIALSVLPYDVPFSEQAIVGTGPFRMMEFTEDRLVLGAFDDYYRERAILDRVEIWRVTAAEQTGMRYQLPEMPASSSATRECGDSLNIEFQEIGCHYMNFNFRKPGIQHDFAFRQAIKHLLNPVQMIAELKKEHYSPAGSFLPERSRQMTFAPSTLEEAAAWLQKSAYQGEAVALFYGEGKKCEEEAKWLQQRCQQIGIRLELRSMTKAEFLSELPDRHADMCMMGEVLQRDIELGLIEVYKNKCTMVHRFLDDEKRARMDERLSAVLSLGKRDERMEALAKIEDELKDELWLLFIYHAKRIDRYHPALRGITLDSFGWIDFSKLWVKSFVTSL
ncbi:ABC transporter substrate-binding protein [Brevibacillus agri]|uniref:SgrR family transcriptional regulator n=1 Tax=Brevibacillus agri TaxID=51101 RepID=UPI0028709392|nr:ABC transporter substrate-binding protein [Brevibacillus agri]MDR9505713.1 ABC transporter substrate-binding protein [Brevibacillus agri]